MHIRTGRAGRWLAIAVITGLTTLASLAGPVAAGGATDPCPGCWHPAPGTVWQMQFTDDLDLSVPADAYDVDMFDTSAATVAELHRRGRRVVCYISAGSWEDWRPDAADYPASVKGKALDGWPGERWLDVRALGLLKPILRARLDRCQAKGFDGVEFDNVDGYTNDTGFPLTGADQRAFDRWLARAAHDRGLAAGLKNDLEQVRVLEPSFEFAINESCWDYDECQRLSPFQRAGKAVLVVEYGPSRAQFCPTVSGLGFSGMRKHRKLDAWRRLCPASASRAAGAEGGLRRNASDARTPATRREPGASRAAGAEGGLRRKLVRTGQAFALSDGSSVAGREPSWIGSRSMVRT